MSVACYVTSASPRCSDAIVLCNPALTENGALFIDLENRSNIYNFIARSEFLGHTMIWKGRWIADLVVSLSARVLNNRLV